MSFVTPWTTTHQALLSTGFPWQEYLSELPFPSPEDLPDPGIEPASSALAGRFFTTELPGKPRSFFTPYKKKKTVAFRNKSFLLLLLFLMRPFRGMKELIFNVLFSSARTMGDL